MLNETSIAAAVGVGVKNTQFASEAANLPRKILVIGTHLSTVLGVAENVPVRVLNAEDAGYRFGFGSMLHRLVLQSFRGSQGVETWVQPQAEAEGAAAAAGSIDYTGSADVVAGTIYLYIAYEIVKINVTAAMTAAQIATATAAAITAIKELPVSAAVDGGTPGKVNLTSKSAGPWGNDISLTLNKGYGQELPAGVVAALDAMSGGAGIPDIGTALDALGTGDSANEDYYTDVVHGYGQDATTLDATLEYVGSGNEFTGLYSKTIGRPFRVLLGDTGAGSTRLNALTALSATRKLDRVNGVIPVPGSASHPAEIAAQSIGHMARINQDRVAQHYLGVALIGIDPGAKADRWTSDYDNRDVAAKNGISPTRVVSGVVTLQNVITFYRPDNVPVASNGFRSMRNISIVQNMLFNIRLNFEQEKWQGISIVEDTTRVSSMVDRQKVRDVDCVIDDLAGLATSFYEKGWIYNDSFTISRLKQAGSVTIRNGGLGFNSTLPVIFSGEGDIFDTLIEFDTSLAVLLK